MGKIDKKAAPAVEKKAKVKKTIEKPKPVKKSPVKKVIKAEKTGISGKFSGIKQKTPKKQPAAKDDNITVKIDGEKAATAPKKQKRTVANKLNQKGVVKINSLPHGFYEDQLKGYFTQFGEVTNVKVMRSLKTGRSKGVAFVEFAVPEVAEIAAETMNNYLLFKSLLKTEYLPPGKFKPSLFRNQVQIVIGADGKKKIKSTLTDRRDREVKTLNKTPTKDQAAKRQAKFADKLKKQNKFLKKLGVDLDVADLVEGKLPVAAAKPKAKAAKAAKKAVVAAPVEVASPEVVQEKKQKAEQKKSKPEAKKPKQTANKPVVLAPVPEKKAAAKPEARKKAAKVPVAAPVEETLVVAPPKKEKAVKSKAAEKKPVKVIKDVPVPVPTSTKTEAKKAEKKKVAKKPAKAQEDSPVKKPVTKKPKKALVLKPTTPPKAPSAAKAKGMKEKKALVKKSIEKKKPLKLNTKKGVK